uniref:Uncharacterized protein n=1 Tax=Meloidogyne incognita TaxID=6306 RepID=A0A914MBM6_MELIC
MHGFLHSGKHRFAETLSKDLFITLSLVLFDSALSVLSNDIWTNWETVTYLESKIVLNFNLRKNIFPRSI